MVSGKRCGFASKRPALTLIMLQKAALNLLIPNYKLKFWQNNIKALENNGAKATHATYLP